MTDANFVRPLTLDPASAISVLGEIARRFGKAWDARLAESLLPPPVQPVHVLTSLAAMGILARQLSRDRLAQLHGPCTLAVLVRLPDPAADEKKSSDCALPPEMLAARLFVLEVQQNQHLASALAAEAGSMDECAPLQVIAVWLLEPGEVVSDSETDAEVGAQPAVRFGFQSVVGIVLKHRSLWRDVLAASFAVQLVGLSIPLLTQTIFDKVIAHQTTSTLITVAVALAVFAFFNSAMTWARQTLLVAISNRVDQRLGSSVFEHLFKLPAVFMERRATGNTVARLAGVQTVRSFLASAAIALALDLPFLCLFLAVMLHYSVQLTLIALGFTTLIAIVAAVSTPFIRQRLDVQYRAAARTQAFSTEHIAAFSTAKVMQLETLAGRRYERLLRDQIEAGRRASTVGIATSTASQLLDQLMTFSILVAGVLLVMRNDGFSIGMLIAFQMFSARLSQPVTRLAGLWGEFQEARIAIRRLGDLMNAPAEPYAHQPTSIHSGSEGKLAIENVSFRYSDTRPMLFQGLSVDMAVGTTTVMVGRSGAGKSTLTKILLGALRPTSGRVLINGRDTRHLAANELRLHFGVVPQDVVLFSGTVLDNVQLGRPGASFEDAVEACQRAGIHETILQLEHGYQTVLGENGSGLSGGQRQRIAIARALIRRPLVLLFDEATSGLDDETANQLGETINELRRTSAILFITHKIPRTLKVDVLCRLPHLASISGSAEQFAKPIASADHPPVHPNVRGVDS